MRINLIAMLFVAILCSGASIPSAIAQSQREEAQWQYTVRPGDTLIGIANRYLRRPQQWPLIKQSNQIADEYHLPPGTVLHIPAKMLRREPARAILETANGVVRWRGEGDSWHVASAGQALGAGCELETVEDASALLRLADGSHVMLPPNSQLVLDTLSRYAHGVMADTRMRLVRGQTEILANPQRRGNQRLQIQTPSAQAVVRGTRFRISFEEGVTREETLEGAVGVFGVGKDVTVTRARGTVVRAGEPPLRPVALLKGADVSALPAHFESLPLRFSLPDLSGAKSWVGQIGPDDRFDRILLSKTASGPVLAFADLPNGNYVLRLRATDDKGLQGLDALHRFSVFARPFSPGLNVPGDGATVRSARPEFAWSAVLDSAHYQLQVATDPAFADRLVDITTDQSTWLPPEDLPAGPLYWRVASISADNQQGPWSLSAAFVFKPGPGTADLGRSALQVDSQNILLQLPLPPEGQAYQAILSPEAPLQPVLSQAQSADGALLLPRPDSGSYYLGVRLVDTSDNTLGPMTVQKIEVMPSRNWLLLLLLPLLTL